MKLLVKIKSLDRIPLAAFIIRIGLGLVFFSGGLSKLSLLLDSQAHQSMVANYTGPKGYINSFFLDFLGTFGIEPDIFLMALSGFEFFAGVGLILGFGVRFFSLSFALLMWTFVMALPVATVSGIDITTHSSPAMLVLIRDIAISGLLFVLYNLGPGLFSLEAKLLKTSSFNKRVNLDCIGLLLRLSLGVVFIVGGLFNGMPYIQSFGISSYVLIPLGVGIISGHGSRYFGLIATAVLLTYMSQKLSLDKSVIANLNGVKREFALLAASFSMILIGTGRLFKFKSFFKDLLPLKDVSA